MKAQNIQSTKVSNRLVLCMSFLTPLITQVGVNSQIVPLKSDTGTITRQNQNLINISGGTTSPNGNNLFHSFSQFNLNTGQVANFLSTPNIQNILGRINGGSASLINGTLQITGSNANLFLMNPAGIVFGANASLNLPASFTATTATGINFNNGQFNAIGNNDYTNLFGNPTAFTFGLNQPGSIVNGGNLSVSPNQNINLIGGTVVSTGTVNAPTGNVNIAAVPGTSLVRVTQPGNLLSLEIPGAATVNFTPATLPQLLTGTGILGITVAGNNVNLDRSNTPIKAGDLVVNNLNSGTATVAASNNLYIFGGNLQTTGDATLRAQDTVAIKDTQQDSVKIVVDGRLLIQGDRAIDIFALNNPNTNISAAGDLTLRSSTTVGGDAYFNTGGNFRIEQLNGKLGGLFSPYDPIIRASGDVSFADYNGASLHIIAGGSVKTGNITITEPDKTTTYDVNTITLVPNGLTEKDDVKLADGTIVKIDGTKTPTLDIRAGVIADKIGKQTPSPTTNNSQSSNSIAGFTTQPTIGSGSSTDSSITVGGNITFVSKDTKSALVTTAPVVLLTNQYAPKDSTPGDISVDGQINTFYTQTTLGSAIGTLGTTGYVAPAPITTITNGGDITIVGRKDITINQLTTGNANAVNLAGTSGTGNIIVKADGNIKATNASGTGLISTENQRAESTGSGNITLTSANGTVTTDRVSTQINNGNSTTSKAGDIDITAAGAISTSTKDIDARSLNTNVGSGSGGKISLVSNNSSIDAGNILTEVKSSSQSVNTANGNGGNVTASAKSDMNLGNIITTGERNNGGNVTLNSGKNTKVGYINTSSGSNGGAVNVTANQFFRAADNTSVNLSPTQTSAVSSSLVPVSIYSNGNTASGAITIRHGGNGLTPFEIGNEIKNGTKGSIVSSNNNALNPPQSLLVSKTQDNIQILTDVQPPITPPTSNPEPNCPPNCTQPPIPPKSTTISIPPISLVDTNQIDTRISENFSDIKPFNKEKPQEVLRKIQNSTGVKPAIIYASFSPPNLALEIVKDKNNISELARNSFQLDLVIVTPNGAPTRHTVAVSREKMLQTVKQFRKEVTNPKNATAFMPTAQQLYQWLIAPLESDLKQQGIQNLVFIMDSGLRGLPIAALHDGKQFLIERYSVGAMPSIGLADTRYVDIRKAKVLAMGAENTPDQAPLPAVPVELKTIATTIWNGKSLENDQFTATNLVAQRQQQPFGILHLATHGEFKPGGPENSYIQFKNERLGFDRFRQLKLNEPPVELMVLSACRTALGDEDAELGFAGSAARTGVKSVMGSLWYVSDEGTLSLMTSFYRNLQTAPIKAEALRQTQVAMLKGKVRLQQGKLITGNDTIDLPPSLLKLGDVSLTHPFYWSAFTIVGNPW
jgi:filamentous hemagglutinin family protein